MAIKINNLNTISELYKQKEFYFNDLHLDFQKSGTYSTVLHKKLEDSDIEMDYDEAAIRNSLRNLFNTRPGQRFLFPKYGLDLSVYVFEPITELIGRRIGEAIVRAVDTFEPRVKLLNCNVIAKPDEHEYDITAVIEIPIFNSIASINSTLDIRKQSFIFVENSTTTKV